MDMNISVALFVQNTVQLSYKIYLHYIFVLHSGSCLFYSLVWAAFWPHQASYQSSPSEKAEPDYDKALNR